METNNRFIPGTPLLTLLCAGVLAFSAVGCKGKHNTVTVQNTVQNEEPPQDAAPHMLSVVRMSDAQAAGQLLSGFHTIESGSWRWTEGKFSVLLRTPPGAGERGGVVSLNFTIPDVAIQKVKSITLTASVNGMALKSADYKAGGSYVFTADVPAAALGAESVKIDFALDKIFRPDGDQRELGVVANSVGIATK